MDRKKKLIPLLLSSAMFLIWACGEGSINEVTDTDERAIANLSEKLDSTKKDYEKNVHEFVDKFLEYCNSKKGHDAGCEAEYKKSSSSKSGDNGSASSNSSSSKTTNSSSSGNTNTSSSKGGTSSSSGGTSNSSSSKTTNSSSSVASSSSKKLETAGKCVLTKPEVAYIGDEISWSYVPDKGTVESAEFTWSFNDDEVEKSIVKGDKSGTGTPKLVVKFSTKGTKVAPTLTFNGKGVECDNVKIAAKDDPVSSSSEPESSSSEPESSSSSSSVPEGKCAVVPHDKPEGFTFENGHWKINGAEVSRKIFVGESEKSLFVDAEGEVYIVGKSVDWFIVDAEGNVLTGMHQWRDYGDPSAEYISGDESGLGSTKVTVKYSKPIGKVNPTVTWNGKTVDCDRNDLDLEDFSDLLIVESLPASSSSAEPEEDSSSSSEEVVEKSSSSKTIDCDEDPESCVF